MLTFEPIPLLADYLRTHPSVSPGEVVVRVVPGDGYNVYAKELLQNYFSKNTPHGFSFVAQSEMSPFQNKPLLPYLLTSIYTEDYANAHHAAFEKVADIYVLDIKAVTLWKNKKG